VVFHRGASGFGLLGSLMAVGSIAAAAFVTLRRGSVSVTMVLGAAVALCVFNGLSGLAPGYFPFAVVLVPVAFAQIMLTVTAISVLQLESAPEYRGRVVALFTVLMMGTAPVTAPLVGWWAEHVGIRSAVVMTSVVALVGTVTVIAAMGGHRRRIPQEANESSSREATVVRP
jgi:predicted MFS family arabinose efflux permease